MFVWRGISVLFCGLRSVPDIACGHEQAVASEIVWSTGGQPALRPGSNQLSASEHLIIFLTTFRPNDVPTSWNLLLNFVLCCIVSSFHFQTDSYNIRHAGEVSALPPAPNCSPIPTSHLGESLVQWEDPWE